MVTVSLSLLSCLSVSLCHNLIHLPVYVFQSAYLSLFLCLFLSVSHIFCVFLFLSLCNSQLFKLSLFLLFSLLIFLSCLSFSDCPFLYLPAILSANLFVCLSLHVSYIAVLSVFLAVFVSDISFQLSPHVFFVIYFSLANPSFGYVYCFCQPNHHLPVEANHSASYDATDDAAGADASADDDIDTVVVM